MHTRVVISVLILLGCAKPRPERVYVVSSEPSYYSPVVRLAIDVDTTADSIVVAVDSGTVRAHGIAQAPGAVMRTLTLEAIVARKPGSSDSSSGLVEPWIPLTTSRPMPLVDSLTFEMAVPVRPLRIAVSRPEGASLQATWLVFRILGDAVTNEIRMADGRVVPASIQRGGVRVYACSERNLAGTRDKDRAGKLATAYATVC